MEGWPTVHSKIRAGLQAQTVQCTIFVMFVSIPVTLGILRHQRRERSIRNIAQAYGLSFVGEVLPRGFPLDHTSVRNASRIRNAVIGDLGAITFIVFDCQFGGGKHSTFQTVVAARGSGERFGFLRYDSTLTRESVDDWTMVFRNKELLLPEEIETLLPPK